eukprot:31001-Pelagococcus_subviridis.AAC.1
MTRLAARDASTRASNAVPAAAREAVDVDVASPMKFSAWGSGMTPGDLDELRASFQARSTHWFPYDRVGVRDGFCILRLDQHLNDDVGHYVDDAKRWEFDEVIEALRFECDALAEGVDLRANDCMVEPMEDVAVDEKRKRKRDARRREKSYDDSDGFGRFYCDCEHQSTSPSPHREREACSARRCGKYFLEKRMTRVAAYLHARARPDRSAFGDYTISHRNEGNSFAMREGRTRMMPNEEDPKYSFEAIHARAVCDALDAVLFRWLPSIAKVFLRSKAAYLFNQHYVVKPGVCADAAEYSGDDEDGGDRFEWHTDANEQLALLPNPDARKQKYVSLWCPLDAVDERNGSLVLRPSGAFYVTLVPIRPRWR